MNLFVPVVGQFVNIGDTLHRKILLSWLKMDNTVCHVFVGKAPDSFVEALGLRECDKVYRSIFSWTSTMLYHSVTKKVGFVFNPGELTMSGKRLLLELGLVPIHGIIKGRGGFVLRVGVAAKSDILIKRKRLWEGILNLSNVLYWRTNKSQVFFEKGSVFPDLAFYDIDSDLQFDERCKLVISMRGDRKAPDGNWYDTVNAIAKRAKLEIIVVSQVRIDNFRTLEIAKRLKASAYTWEDDVSHNEQESMLNELYRKSTAVISDRLHVLIAAYTKGVIPVNLAVTKSKKVDDHFDVVNLKNVTINIDDYASSDVINMVSQRIEEGFDIQIRDDAKARLDIVRNEIVNFVK